MQSPWATSKSEGKNLYFPAKNRECASSQDFFTDLLLQIINGSNWSPEFSESSKYKNWIAVLDLKTCTECRKRHGKIWLMNEQTDKEPPLHPNCRCSILIMKTVKSGTATTKGLNGADWTLKYESKLPDYYIEYKEAEKLGFKNFLGNLRLVAPDRMITRGVYKNRNGHLPSREGRIWYEADINYKFGYRNNQRIVYSNDGLIFVTYDHYKTFFEIV